MYSTENFVKYLKDNHNDLEETIIQTSNFIYRNDMLNVIYEVKDQEKEPILQIVHIGAPTQVVSVLTHSVTAPLRQIVINLGETPVLRRVFSEKKSIYFRKPPELVTGLLPNIKQTYQINKTLQQLGITDVAVVPIVLEKLRKEFILAVLGPLTDDQKKFIKDVAMDVVNYYASYHLNQLEN